MYNGSVYLNIPRTGRVITIWYKVLCKIRGSVDVLITSNRVFSESSHRIGKHIDVVVEVLEVQSIISFGLYLDEEFVEFL